MSPWHPIITINVAIAAGSIVVQGDALLWMRTFLQLQSIAVSDYAKFLSKYYRASPTICY